MGLSIGYLVRDHLAHPFDEILGLIVKLFFCLDGSRLWQETNCPANVYLVRLVIHPSWFSNCPSFLGHPKSSLYNSMVSSVVCVGGSAQNHGSL
jgi:hypothetical protein